MEAKVESFDGLMKKLFVFSEEVLQLKKATQLAVKESPVSKYLKNYIKVYNITKPEEHIPLFSKVYNENKLAINRSIKSLSWIVDDEVTVRFGDDKESRKYSIMLSAIYRACKEISQAFEDRIKKLPEKLKVKETSSGEEMKYPHRFQLMLYRIFREVAEERDQTVLTERIRELEEITGDVSETPTVDLLGGGGLDGIVKMVSGLLQNNGQGLKLPEGIKFPSGDEIGQALSGIVNSESTQSLLNSVGGGGEIKETLNKVLTNENTKTLISDVGQKLTSGGTDLNSIFGNVMKLLSDSPILETMKATIGGAMGGGSSDGASSSGAGSSE